MSFVALGFGIAAALSSWNPLAAPFGVVVGVAAAFLSARALRRPGRRAVAAAALAMSVLAVAASAIVLALGAGLGRELRGTPVVQAPEREDVAAELEGAAERTHAARERASAELDALEPEHPSTRVGNRAR